MTEVFKYILKTQELENNKMLGMFYKISFMTGVNLKYKTGFKDPIKLVNAFLITVSLMAVVAQYALVWKNRHEAFAEIADPICTSNQAWISIYKLIYLAFVQHEFYELMHTATAGTLLYDLGVFDLDINCKQRLMHDVKDILAKSWLHIKHQIYFFIINCLLACGFYMFSSIFSNYYFTYIQPQNFTLQLRAICFDGVFIIIVVHCSTLFEVLNKLLDYATDEVIPQPERIHYIKCCVRLHDQIYRYYSKINGIYCNPSLAQCVLSISILCIVMFMVNVGLEEDILLFFKMFCFLCAAVFQIGIYCYNGQKIITQSEMSPSTWYSCSWYNESKEFKYIIDMMILRCNHTFYLQVSGFASMSHMTLLSIVHTSGSYFILLRNISGMD